MKMMEDTPDELLTELFHAKYFPDHSLGRPIEGTEETVSSFDQATTSKYHADIFAPRNLVIGAAGNVQHDQILDLVSEAFAGSENGQQTEFDSVAPRIAA